jgi:succinate dehydrogenase/fumarate reductase cytochrome b subunit
MKRIDYFWPSALTRITGIILLTQSIVEIVGQRKDGYEWVFPLCAWSFVASIAWALFAITWNAIRARGEA